MFDFIPIDLYYPFYINLSFGIVLFTLIHTYVLSINDERNILYINTTGYIYLFFIILYVGTRPIHPSFGDMGAYYHRFLGYASGLPVTEKKDVLFQYFMKICSAVMPANIFFTLCSYLYIYPLYKVSKKFFNEYWFYAFLMFIVSFSFWSYGTNGIRNGLATSLFLLALSYYDNKIILIIIMIFSSLMHKTLMLPIFAFTLAYFYTKPKTYIIIWFVAIPLSIALGSFWEQLFASIGFGEDDRLQGYLTSKTDMNTGKKGFRYDFLVYSAGAVFTGWYFIFKKNFKDKIYFNLYNTYLLCNAFWILVIRANFSNRFAYLSWFLMGIVIIYPFLKKEYFEDHHFKTGKVLLVYFMFTYLMYLLYYD